MTKAKKHRTAQAGLVERTVRIFMIERKISVPVYLTPEELAFEFSNMDDTGQAEFFNCLHKMTEKWERPLCFQLQYVTDNIVLTDGGRMVMEQIGDYAKLSAAQRKANRARL